MSCSECDCEASIMRRPWPLGAVAPWKKKINLKEIIFRLIIFMSFTKIGKLYCRFNTHSLASQAGLQIIYSVNASTQ